ncbi:MAG TPA: nitrogen fixation protein FixH [Thiotrichales bacterium]|nr:nitrogen fixation protein FixH [Thiotrichales bacterium]
MPNARKRISQHNSQALRNPWVLGWLALVVVVFAVNAGMVITAVVTNPGLVDEDYYEKGRDFERTFVSRMEARNRLGWSVALELPPRIALGEQALYRFVVTDDRGLPLTGAHVSVHAYRPSDADADFRFPMEEVAPGRYEAKVSFPLKGIWDVMLKVEREGDNYELQRRISVAAS